MNLLVLSVDRFHWAFTGPLGNRWIHTPNWNRLAAEGLVFQQCFATSSSAEEQIRTLWSGGHPIARKSRESITSKQVGKILPQTARQMGWNTYLHTDSAVVATMPEVSHFNHIKKVDTEDIYSSDQRSFSTVSDLADSQPRCVEHWEESNLAYLFTDMYEQLTDISERSTEPFLFWSHLESLGRVWDAPFEFREQYVEYDDPDVEDSAWVPRYRLAKHYDPDELLGIQQAYAGQISLLDLCLAPLIEWLNEDAIGRQTALLLTGTRGFPIGEHFYIGDYPHLYSELTHVPTILRLPEGRLRAVRSQNLTEISDLSTILSELVESQDTSRAEERLTDVSFFTPTIRTTESTKCIENDTGNSRNGESSGALSGFSSSDPLTFRSMSPDRDRIVTIGEDKEFAIVTEHWYLRYLEAQPESAELYLRKDDPFQVNDVANRCGDVTAALISVIQQFRADILHGKDPYQTPLPSVVHIPPD